MTKHDLCIETLENSIRVFLFRIPQELFLYRDFYENLINNGFRLSELLDYNRFQVLQDNIITFQPLKRNNLRLFTYNDLTPLFYNSIVNRYPLYHSFSVHQTYTIFQRYFPIQNIHHRTKPLSNHVFRHYYAKQLLLSGLTEEQIQSKMGEKNLISSNGYVYSKLTYYSF
jgi:integrase